MALRPRVSSTSPTMLPQSRVMLPITRPIALPILLQARHASKQPGNRKLTQAEHAKRIAQNEAEKRRRVENLLRQRATPPHQRSPNGFGKKVLEKLDRWESKFEAWLEGEAEKKAERNRRLLDEFENRGRMTDAKKRGIKKLREWMDWADSLPDPRHEKPEEKQSDEKPKKELLGWEPMLLIGLVSGSVVFNVYQWYVAPELPRGATIRFRVEK